MEDFDDDEIVELDDLFYNPTDDSLDEGELDLLLRRRPHEEVWDPDDEPDYDPVY